MGEIDVKDSLITELQAKVAELEKSLAWRNEVNAGMVLQGMKENRKKEGALAKVAELEKENEALKIARDKAHLKEMEVLCSDIEKIDKGFKYE